MARPHINDLIDPTLLQDMIAGGYIRTRQHDTLPLTLYSYTEKAHAKLEQAIWKALKPSGDTYMNSGAADEVAA